MGSLTDQTDGNTLKQRRIIFAKKIGHELNQSSEIALAGEYQLSQKKLEKCIFNQ